MTRAKQTLPEKTKKASKTHKKPVTRTRKNSASIKPVWYVYAIECDNKSVYIGQSRNLVQRWEQHCQGKGARWTRKYKPVRLFYAEKCFSFKQAWKRERELKKTMGRSYLKKILKESPDKTVHPIDNLLVQKNTLKPRTTRKN